MFRTNLMKDNPRVPLCDQCYITLVDEVENGWLIPFFGFIPDKRMGQIKKRVLGMFGKTA
jgi:hypothetical protein